MSVGGTSITVPKKLTRDQQARTSEHGEHQEDQLLHHVRGESLRLQAVRHDRNDRGVQEGVREDSEGDGEGDEDGRRSKGFESAWRALHVAGRLQWVFRLIRMAGLEQLLLHRGVEMCMCRMRWFIELSYIKQALINRIVVGGKRRGCGG